MSRVPGTGGTDADPHWDPRRVLGIAVLGEHQPAPPPGGGGGARHDPLPKPRAIARLDMPRGAAAGQATVNWLSDLVAPPQDPRSAEGTVMPLGSATVRLGAPTLVQSVTRADLLDAAAACPFVQYRLTSCWPMIPTWRQRVLLPAEALVAALCNRWDDLTRWRPGRKNPDRDGCVPEYVKHALRATVAIATVHRLGPSQQQVDYDAAAARPRMKTGLDLDVVLRVYEPTEAVAVWFTALCEHAAWAGIGADTTTGLGQLAVRPMVGLDALYRY